MDQKFQISRKWEFSKTENLKFYEKWKYLGKKFPIPQLWKNFTNEYEAKNGEIRLQKLANMHRKWLFGHYFTFPRPFLIMIEVTHGKVEVLGSSDGIKWL